MEHRHVHAIVSALSRHVHSVNRRVTDGSCFLWQKRFDEMQNSVVFCPLPPSRGRVSLFSRRSFCCGHGRGGVSVLLCAPG